MYGFERLVAAGTEIAYCDDALRLRGAQRLEGVAAARGQAAGVGLTVHGQAAAVGEDASPAQQARGFLALAVERVDPVA